MAKKKKVDIDTMNYTELVRLFAIPLNHEIPINAAILYVVFREFHKHLIDNYVLKAKKKILVPDKTTNS